MATATVTVKKNSYPSGSDNTARHEIVFGTITIGASPAVYVAGGLPLAMGGIATNTSIAAPPVWAEFVSTSGGGNLYVYQAPTLSPPVGPMLRIYVAGVELAAGAIPVGVSGDVIAFRAEFNKSL